MLAAIDREKTKFHLRYKGIRGDFDKGRITAEDEITSLVFDPMQYLPVKDVASFWEKLIGDDLFSKEVPNSLDVKFWPSKPYLENGVLRRVEPDLRLDFKWGDGCTKIILVEIKWGSGLSDGQLQKQWSSYLSSKERRSAKHVFIGKSADIGDEGHRGGVVVKSWRDVQDVLNSFRERGGAVARWAMLVSGFLGKITARPFKGFGPLAALDAGKLRFYATSDFFTGDCLSQIAELKCGTLSFYHR